MSWPRVFASIAASAVGLAFWWALTEPLPVPPSGAHHLSHVLLVSRAIPNPSPVIDV